MIPILIRWINNDDRFLLDYFIKNNLNNFDSYTDKCNINLINTNTSKYNSLVAVDRMSGNILGVVWFSIKENRIIGVSVPNSKHKRDIESKLLKTALRQLNNNKEHASNGNSFHYKYPEYLFNSKKENCPCCNNIPMPASHALIVNLDYSIVCAERNAQGKLFGKCYVLIYNHYVDFEDIAYDEMSGFMSDIQKVGRALHKVTGAVKINYEIHSNSAPHIHCHLFPRYLDDDYPSRPIDYRITEPSPYESDEEYMWFIKQMQEELLWDK